MKDILFWDLDETLINFKEAEKTAIKSLFSKFNLGFIDEEMLKDYRQINAKYWLKLEKGEASRNEILVDRFKEFFSKYNLDISIAQEFNEAYQLELGETIVFNDDSYNLLNRLHKKYRQYIITNGTSKAQTKKLAKSKLYEVVDEVFISEEVGYAKPSKEFFEYVLNKTNIKDKSRILIIGDSLTSDIKGGNDMGIDTCLYNSYHNTHIKDIKPKYVISNLKEVEDIINAL